MKTEIERISHPELMFGFVAPIGADIDSTRKAFHETFQRKGYRVVDIKVTSIFKVLARYIKPKIPLVDHPLFERFQSYIAYGNQLREHFDNQQTLAACAIIQIVRHRSKINPSDQYKKTVYLIHQFKRKEEIELLRSVYGRLFFQISIYSRRGSRVDKLSRDFGKSNSLSGPHRFRGEAEKLILQDENQSDVEYGQRVAKMFHDADLIINTEGEKPIPEQVARFCDLLFGSNKISPNKMEYGMFMAQAAAFRTLDLSRQVGAAIFSKEGEIITLGSNEVPKAGGGTYWEDGDHDDREYARAVDSNDQRKKEILTEIARLIDGQCDLDALFSDQRIGDSQLMDALEYGRIVHAEMSAISDAARLGRTVKDGKLYCTTFPCHMCAKHIVAAGITEVVFLEPYPKSLASDLHNDSIEIEGGDRGKYSRWPSVKFGHFYGVTPRRYRELFGRTSRKFKGTFQEFMGGREIPIIDIKHPFYGELEQKLFAQCSDVLAHLAAADAESVPG